MRKLALLCVATALAIAAAFCLFGCDSQSSADENLGGDPGEPSTPASIFEETISPNAKYAESEEDIVYYTVRVTQSAPDTATVSAESNSGFFEPASYDVANAGDLTVDDVSVTWTTLMGNPEASEDDQFAVAVVSVRTADGGTDERKISFVTGALEMVAETTQTL